MKLSMIEQGKQLENIVEFSRYTQQIRRKIWRLLAVMVVTAVIALPLIKLITSKYVATSVVMIKALQDDATPLPQLSRYDATRSDFYETQYALIQSRVVLEKAITQLQLDRDPAFNGGIEVGQSTAENAAQRQAKTLKNLVNNLSVSGVRNTQLIDISYQSPLADTAARVANGVAQAYIDYSIEQKHKAIEEAQRWNQQQMDRVQQDMVAQKAAINDFLKKENLLTFRGVDGYETEELGIITNRLADATQRRIVAQSQYDEVQKALAKHSPEEIISMPEFSGHAQIQDLRIALTQTRRNLAEVRKRYGAKHDKFLEAQAQVGAVNAQIGQVISELARGASQQYQAALEDENRYKAMLDSQKGNFQQLAGKRDQYNTMMTALNKTQELYQSLYQRAHEQALSISLDQSDAIISDPAVPPELPAKPNKMMLWMIVVMLVTLTYLVWIIVGTALNNTVNRMSQLGKNLRLTALGELPILGLKGDRQQISQRLLSEPLYADLVHAVRTQLLLSTPSPQVMVIASCEASEGRSLLAETLATSFSVDQKTLLIDMDFVNGKEGGSVANEPGLADVIQGQKTVDEVLVKHHGHLSFLPRGNLHGSTLLMFTSPQFSSLMTTLRSQYQRIIIDVPAVNQSQDGQLIGRQADGVLLLIQANRLQMADVQAVHATLVREQNRLLGAVLNQVNDDCLESREGLRLINQQVGDLMTPVKSR